MPDTQALIKAAYAAFNQRNIDAALALMTEDVRWPKASEGGSVVGKPEIRAYWTRQWQQFDPTVEPLAITPLKDGRTDVKVHQRVKSLNGELLFDGEVLHIYTIKEGFIAGMDLPESEATAETPTPAFARH